MNGQFEIGNTAWQGRTDLKPFKNHLKMELAALADGRLDKHPRGSLRWQAQRLCLEGSLNSTLAIRDTLDGKPAQEIISSGENADVVRQLRDWLAWTRMPEIIDAVTVGDTRSLQPNANDINGLAIADLRDPLAEANPD